MQNEMELIANVKQSLIAQGVRVFQEVSIKGFWADLLIDAPDGRQAVIVIKMSSRADGGIARAGNVSTTLEAQLGVDRVFVVFGDEGKNWPSRNVYRPDGIAFAVDEWIKESSSPIRKTIPTLKQPKKTIFAAMPFDEQFDDTFAVAIRHAADSVGATAIRVDEEEFTGDIVQKIRDEIEGCSALIVDLSEAKANVMFEAGFGHALDKPCVHICSSSLSKLPFDVSHQNTLAYKIGQANKLKTVLAKRLAAALAGK